MTPNHLISIIIPVYNAEKYLEACLDSISKQSHENIQIILVNDGSSDRSSEICNNYESRDSRATVIHQTNKGASSARNTGLSAARGEYVTFIDSDDTVHNDYIKLLMSQMSDSLDVTSCQMTPSLAGLSPSFERSLTMSGQDAVASLLYGKGIITGPYCKLFRASVVKDIRFNEEYTIAEDLLFNCLALSRAKRVAHFDAPLYYYRQSESGITRKVFTPKRMDGLYAIQSMLSYFSASSEIVKAAQYRLFMEAIFVAVTIDSDKKAWIKERIECLSILTKYRTHALHNKNARVDNRVLAAITLVSRTLAIQLYRLKIFIHQTIRQH